MVTCPEDSDVLLIGANEEVARAIAGVLSDKFGFSPAITPWEEMGGNPDVPPPHKKPRAR